MEKINKIISYVIKSFSALLDLFVVADVVWLIIGGGIVIVAFVWKFFM